MMGLGVAASIAVKKSTRRVKTTALLGTLVIVIFAKKNVKRTSIAEG